MEINDTVKIINGDCLTELDKLDANVIDCIVTDPPYELNFMGKGWDNAGVSFNKETWAKCLRALKPGGYLLAFGGTRTYHRIACAVEDAGFEIRDCIMWLYGSGFPKSMDIEKAINKREGDTSETAKQWRSWGTALKPAYEPIIVARKPFKGSLVDNILKNGIGGLNIDECRIKYQSEADKAGATPQGKCTSSRTSVGVPDTEGSGRKDFERPELKGRFPANIILTYDETDYDEVCGNFPNSGSGNGKGVYSYRGVEYHNKDTSMFNGDKPQSPSNYNDTGSASRYFYCAKASRRDRDEGLEEFEKKTKVFNGKSSESSKEMKDVEKRFTTQARNTHPTVKPTSLMQYLIKLVAPKGTTILDPFMGSGSTGKAAIYENKDRDAGYKFIGIEKEEEYCKIAEARIKSAMEIEK